jgi:hypothetical protein
MMRTPMSVFREEWIPVSVIAKEYNKNSVTIKRWCSSGFILRLGFRIKRDPKGRWMLLKIN